MQNVAEGCNVQPILLEINLYFNKKCWSKTQMPMTPERNANTLSMHYEKINIFITSNDGENAEIRIPLGRHRIWLLIIIIHVTRRATNYGGKFRQRRPSATSRYVHLTFTKRRFPRRLPPHMPSSTQQADMAAILYRHLTWRKEKKNGRGPDVTFLKPERPSCWC